RFPLPAKRRYTPSDAVVGDLAVMLKKLDMTRVVIVQPSFYGTDNACMLDGIAQLGNARGVAVIAPDTPEKEVDILHDQGIRGLRINIATTGGEPVDSIKSKITAAAKLCEKHRWHVQMFVDAETIAPLASLLRSLPVDSVFDHFGLIAPGTTNGALRALQGLLESGKTWVKISGAYRIGNDPNDKRIDPLTRALCQANPQRIVWGSDWPHPNSDAGRGRPLTEISAPFAIDDGLVFNQLGRWIPDAAIRKKILVDNPARLYGFENSAS
ncbi:MAG TPA: amidohydrolase family protein, partial [Burkholderiales bacterium]